MRDEPIFSIILAAGKGKRMRAAGTPKVCFEVARVPVIGGGDALVSVIAGKVGLVCHCFGRSSVEWKQPRPFASGRACGRVFLTFSCYRRSWQAGPGQDRNIYESATAHRIIEYTHNKAVQRGLVERAEDRPWSSACDRAGDADTLFS